MSTVLQKDMSFRNLMGSKLRKLVVSTEEYNNLHSSLYTENIDYN